MFKLNSLLVNCRNNVCRKLFVSMNTKESFLRGNCEPTQTFCFSAVRLEEAAESTKSTTDFSYLPPLPGQDSPLRWSGKKFEELPIAHIRATYNNTLINVRDIDGKTLVKTSCGAEGFKNIKKSTPIAAQTTGISAATKAVAKGLTHVRIVVKGLGPGRQFAIKGLSMGGLDVVSITDNTAVPHNGCRPRKVRRV
ncbi:28S ribosomal protein S11, mitochondrial [Thalassophryne amazonica]|uniref:28S ribosomal protein S11, mitochondrial n=1 Tax=Thalassophryne amazonica TaxID=390379 RepID=UPI001471CBE1|nr:28S ribosomal protein S11, mitochondrial [Thalassophryne amazonica]